MRTGVAFTLALVMICSPAVAGEYPWLADVEGVDTVRLESRFPVPDGFVRVPVRDGSYADWLRGLPVRTDRKEVRTYTGASIGSPSSGVVLLDVGRRNLQQCADSVIRLHAEYHWQRGGADKVGYHFTSGDLSTWKAWRHGERFSVKGSRVKRVRGGSRKADHSAFRVYLDHVFRYAGTRSLHRDSEPMEGPIEGGDFFVQGGAPGHAIIVLDVAVHPDGRRVGLVGQGFLPAQEFHIVGASGSHVLNAVWFLLPETGAALDTPSWSPFERSSLRRFTLR
jgi:hypothetical protein